MRKKFWQNWQFWVGAVISLAAIAYFLHEMSGKWAAVWNAFLTANYIYIIPSVLLLFFSIYLRGLRWQLCFWKVKRVPHHHLFAYQNIGFMGNSIYPLRAGEIFRPFLLSRKEGIPFTLAFGTVTVERVFDLVATLGGFAVATTYYTAGFTAVPKSPSVAAFWEKIGIIQIASCLLLAGVLIAGALMTYAPGFGELVIRFLLRTLLRGREDIAEKIVKMYHHFADGFAVLRDPRAILLGFAYTVAIWVLLLISEYFIVLSMGLQNLAVGPMGMLFIMMTLALFVAAPQGPAYIGTFQFAVALAAMFMMEVGGYPAFGATPEAAANAGRAGAFALMLWFSQMIPIIIAGWISLGALGLKLGKLKHDAEEIQDIKAQEQD
jgi:uncharacterized protein (TIRG00374 family)